MSDASQDRTEHLVTGLVEDLRPVRPLPRISVSVAVMVAVWSLMLVGVLIGHSVGGARAVGGDPLARRVWLVCLLGLGVTALGGSLAALAAGRPGQTRLEALGIGIAGLGLLAGIGSCVVALLVLGVDPRDSIAADAMCLRKGFLLALLPLAVLLGLLFRSWVGRPLVAAAIALTGGTAFGAVVTLLGCPSVSARHLLIGHIGVPISMAILGFYPLSFLLRRIAR